jgi:hypothetical protein
LLCCLLGLASILQQDNNLFCGNTLSYHWITKYVLIHLATNDLRRRKTMLDDWRETVVRSECACGFCIINNSLVGSCYPRCAPLGREQAMIEIGS